jgi:hypothetical protein
LGIQYYSHFGQTQVPYLLQFSAHFSAAYDAYLDICRHVDKLIDSALGYNTCAGHIFRSCPCCFYQLEGEAELEFSCFVSLDGNNSLKHLGTSVLGKIDRLDSWTISSDRWVTVEEVDKFKDKVKPRVIACFSTD